MEKMDARIMEKALEVFLGEDVEEAAVYVERRSVIGEGDGRMAKAQVLVGARDGRSPVEAFRRLYPAAWDAVPQSAVWGFGVEDDEVAASFEIGQDAELAAWLQEAF